MNVFDVNSTTNTFLSWLSLSFSISNGDWSHVAYVVVRLNNYLSK